MVRGGISGIEADGLTRLSSIKFNVADVAKPLASAVKVAEAGNLIVMHPDDDKWFIQNIISCERMQLRKERGTFVFDVVFEDTGEDGKVTLDSCAGVSVGPKDKFKSVHILVFGEVDLGNKGPKGIGPGQSLELRM